MIRKTPPLEAIEIFVAAARGDSLRSVARDMALSPSAISRLISGLETFLGVILFDRVRQTLVLNAAGRRYLALIEPAISTIQRATTMLVDINPRRLSVATSHSFASGWLLPRLPELLHHHDIDIELVPCRDFNVLRSGEAKIGIWGGLAVPDDMIAERMFDVRAFPVCAPRLADGRLPPVSDAMLTDYPLLAVRSPGQLWQRWFTSAGLSRSPPQMREYDTLHMMYEAASAGLGIALAMPLIAESLLLSGKLMRCAEGCRSLGETYQLYRADSRIARSAIEQRFASWLQKAIADSLEAFGNFADHHKALSAPRGNALAQSRC